MLGVYILLTLLIRITTVHLSKQRRLQAILLIQSFFRCHRARQQLKLLKEKKHNICTKPTDTVLLTQIQIRDKVSEAVATAQAEAEEKEQQRLVEKKAAAEAKAQAEAEEKEQQRLAEDKAAAEAKAQAEAEEKEQQRLAEEKAAAEAKARAEAEEKEQQRLAEEKEHRLAALEKDYVVLVEATEKELEQQQSEAEAVEVTETEQEQQQLNESSEAEVEAEEAAEQEREQQHLAEETAQAEAEAEEIKKNEQLFAAMLLLSHQKTQQAAAKLQNRLRVFLARRRLDALKARQKYAVIVNVKSARNLAVAGQQSGGNFYVVVSVVGSTAPSASTDGRSSIKRLSSTSNLRRKSSFSFNKSSLSSDLLSQEPVLSQYRTELLSNVLNPSWNEKAVTVNFTPATDKLKLTIYNKEGKEMCLGHVYAVSKANRQELLKGKTVNFTNVPVNDNVSILSGESSTSTDALINRGTLDFDLTLVPRQNVHFGWVMKLANSKVVSLGQSSFKQRFLLLLNGTLSYFDDELSLNQPRDSIRCSEITAVHYGHDKKYGKNVLRIRTKTGSSDWALQWMPEETETGINNWLKKIEAACYPLTITNEIAAKVTSPSSVTRTRSVSSSMNSASTTGTEQEPGSATKSKSLRRQSSSMFSSWAA